MTGSWDCHGAATRDACLREHPISTWPTADPTRETRKSEPLPEAGTTAGLGHSAGVARLLSPRSMAYAGSENVPLNAKAATSFAAACRNRVSNKLLAPASRAGHVGTKVLTQGFAGASSGPLPRGKGPSARLAGPLSDITNLGATCSGTPKALGSIQQPPLASLLAAATVTTPTRTARGATPRTQRQEGFSSIPEADLQDVQGVSEYASDVSAALFQKEALLLPRPDYMEEQRDVNGRMRAVLIDWLVEVHKKYRLRLETLFLSVNIIDRYLSVRTVTRQRLQLLGLVALLIGSKFEEIDPPTVAEFAYIADHTYTRQDVLNMECTVLVALGFEIAVPTPAHFLDRLMRANGCDAVHRSVVQYALEVALLDLRALRYLPSALVGACLLLSNELLGRRPLWPANMSHHTKHSEASLRSCVEDLKAILDKARTASLQAVRRKYQSEQYFAVADMIPLFRTQE